jgi:hypothetical protein
MFRTLRISILLLLGAQTAHSQDFFEWRGPGRTGVYNETGLLKKWPDGGPQLLWSVNTLPKGHSSVSIGNGTLFLTGLKDTMDVLVALDLKGNIKWQLPFGRTWMQSFPESRSTPTYEKGKVYAASGYGDVVCVDANSGKILWSVKSHEKFSGSFGRWGVAESPMIVDNKLIITPCGDKTTVVALNKETGETVWTSESLNDVGVYASPILVDRDKQRIIVTLSGNYVLGVNPTDGKILWKFEFGKYIQPEGRNNHATTPLYYNGNLYITSGYNHNSVMLKLSDDLTSASLAWVDQVLDNHLGGVVRVGSYIYGSNWLNNGMGKWVCLDWNSGKVMYETEWFNKGAIIANDGYLYCIEEKTGNMALVKASPEKFEIISSFKIPLGTGPYWAHPVICNGTLYVRHGEALMAYNLKEN